MQMVITEHVLYLIIAGLFNYPSKPFFFYSLNFCRYLNFCQEHAICISCSCSQGDYIRQRFANMTFTLCTVYNKSHAISYKRNMTNVALFLSCSRLPVLALKSCNQNVYPHFHILPFLLHYSMASCCFEILR